MEGMQSLVPPEHTKMEGARLETSFGFQCNHSGGRSVPALSHHPERNGRHEAGSYRTTICYHTTVLSDLPTA